jgi:RNA polymerase sigma-70 factor, ECF subfamily
MISISNSNPVEMDDDVSGTHESSSLGSKQRFAQLVLDNIDFVWRILRRYGVPEPEVDDATQQVLLVTNQKLSSIPLGSERPFLLAVAARVASHAHRAGRRRAAAQLRFSQHDQLQAPNPEGTLQRLEARDLLDRVLEDMPTNVRYVFVLFELEGLTVDEVAKVLELPRGTVASRIKRGRFLFQRGVRLRTLPGGKV